MDEKDESPQSDEKGLKIDLDCVDNPAMWVFGFECPNCIEGGHEGMMAADKYGFFCVMSGCGYSETYQEAKDKKRFNYGKDWELPPC